MAAGTGTALSRQATTPSAPDTNLTTPDKLLLKDYRPTPLYKIPKTEVSKAKYSVIDMHTHSTSVHTPEGINEWVKHMDAVGVEKTVLLSCATGAQFDEIYRLYSQYPNRYEVWCTFDVDGFEEPGFTAKAVKKLERCYRVGARGVGELMD
jgi:hypothetical protein